MQRDIDRYRPLPDEHLEASVRDHLESATARQLDAETFDHLFAQWEGAEGQALYLRNLTCFDEADTEVFEALLPSISVPGWVGFLLERHDCGRHCLGFLRVAGAVKNRRGCSSWLTRLD